MFELLVLVTIILVVAYLCVIAAGKFIKDGDISRIVQGVIIVIAALAIARQAGLI